MAKLNAAQIAILQKHAVRIWEALQEAIDKEPWIFEDEEHDSVALIIREMDAAK